MIHCQFMFSVFLWQDLLLCFSLLHGLILIASWDILCSQLCIAHTWALPSAFHHCQCFILFNCAVPKVLLGCILISVACGLLIVVMRCFTHANSQLCLCSICVPSCTWLCCFALPLLACVNFSAVLYDKAVYLCNHLNRHFHLEWNLLLQFIEINKWQCIMLCHVTAVFVIWLLQKVYTLLSCALPLCLFFLPHFLHVFCTLFTCLCA